MVEFYTNIRSKRAFVQSLLTDNGQVLTNRSSVMITGFDRLFPWRRGEGKHSGPCIGFALHLPVSLRHGPRSVLWSFVPYLIGPDLSPKPGPGNHSIICQCQFCVCAYSPIILMYLPACTVSLSSMLLRRESSSIMFWGMLKELSTLAMVPVRWTFLT